MSDGKFYGRPEISRARRSGANFPFGRRRAVRSVIYSAASERSSGVRPARRQPSAAAAAAPAGWSWGTGRQTGSSASSAARDRSGPEREVRSQSRRPATGHVSSRGTAARCSVAGRRRRRLPGAGRAPVSSRSARLDSARRGAMSPSDRPGRCSGSLTGRRRRPAVLQTGPERTAAAHDRLGAARLRRKPGTEPGRREARFTAPQDESGQQPPKSSACAGGGAGGGGGGTSPPCGRCWCRRRAISGPAGLMKSRTVGGSRLAAATSINEPMIHGAGDSIPRVDNGDRPSAISANLSRIGRRPPAPRTSSELANLLVDSGR